MQGVKSVKSKRAKKLFWGRLIFFVITSALLFALLCGVGAGYVFLSTKLHGFSFADTYTYKIGMDSTSERRLETITYQLGDVGDESVLYINFTALQTYCGFYESGDREEYRFILPSDRSEFSVTDGSARADVNGNIIYMEAPAVVKGGSLYLPLSFVDCYIGGITVENDVNEVKSEETGETEEVVDEYTYIIRCNENNEYYLLLSKPEPCLPIDKSELN